MPQILLQCVQKDEEKNAGRNPPAALNGHAQLYFFSHGEDEDMEMIVHVADAEENGHYPIMIRNLVLFFSPRFPHY